MFGRRAVFLLAVLACACGRDAGSSDGERTLSLNGAGATFPFPLYSKWIAEYHRLYPNVRINYQSIGSGGGIRQLVAETVDFGATDAAVRDEEARSARGSLLHLPTAVGSLAIGYRLDGVSGELRLTPGVLAGIFLGEIQRWNDPELAVENPRLALPDRAITVVFRTDGSGSTAALTEYLSRVSPIWKEQVGSGKSVRWPVGLGAKGNEGVAGLLQGTPGSIGYLELAYAKQSGLPSALLRNHAGKFVAPSPSAALAAAESVEMPEGFRVSLIDAPGEAAYPIASYTYLLVYEKPRDAEKGRALARFLWWALHDGQRYAEQLDYAPLPASVLRKLESKLQTQKLLDGV
ncbi:MAG: phosphate ABC transporter substrate-binding protein PstS [Myxococcota bacterium]|jgi:phosphate transport system substrate-binding protein|nr:phosphate ABC transporter substrate-binding protein PstS [Myxococcota bacterium]